MSTFNLSGKFLLHLCVLLSPLLGLAQNHGNGPDTDAAIRIKGQVVAAVNGQALDFATVSLFLKCDSSLVTGTITNETGLFTLEARPGQYYATVEFLSFERLVIDDIELERGQQDLDLGQIRLKEDVTMLQEIEVVAEKSTMELKLDKRVFNVGKDLSNAGGNAAEILDNVPSVTVDIDGNVSLRGSENVRILIDGKPSGLVGISGNDALRQMQGSMIDRIEVVTNPSARYDAEGEVGIINIILKKGIKQGVNGAFGLTAGHPDNYGASYNLNLRQEKINLFSNFGINYRNNDGGGNSYQQLVNSDTAFYYDSQRSHERRDLSANIQLGMDWYLNDKNILTASGLYRRSLGDNTSLLQYRDYDRNAVLINTTRRDNDEEETQNVVETALSYQKLFDRKDQKWTVDVKYFLNDDTELADYDEISDAENAVLLLQRSRNTEDERNFLFQTDYTHPFGENGMLEAGLKATLRGIENDFLVEEQNDANEWVALPSFDDQLGYDENIYAAYVMGGTKIDKLSFQLGLRAEYSDITTTLLASNTRNTRNYLNWFPSAHFSYEISEVRQVQLSYSRRLSRPNFRYLLPFTGLSDSRNNRVGNPDLNPEYTHSIELGYLNYFPKGSLLSSVYYRHRTGEIERIRILNDDGTTLSFPINLATQNAYGLEFSLTYDIAKWWRTNANFNFYRAISEGEYEGQRLYSDTYTMSSRATSKITLFKSLDVQASVNYRAPQNEPQGRRLAVWSADLGLAKDVMKKRGTLTLSARDLFNTRKWRSITEFDDYYATSEFQWRSRQIVLSFNYRLNQQKKRNEREREGDGGGNEDMGF